METFSTYRVANEEMNKKKRPLSLSLRTAVSPVKTQTFQDNYST